MINLPRLLKYLTAIFLMVLVIQFLGPYTFPAGAVELETSVKFNLLKRGKTFIHLPPLGHIAASTHSPPLDIHFTLKNIQLNTSADFGEELRPKSGLPNPLIGTIKTCLIKYYVYLLFISFCLGAGSILLWRRQAVNIRESLALGLVNGFVLLFFLAASLMTYDVHAFSRAEYEGMVEAAPLVMGVLEEGDKLIENLAVQFGEVVHSISILQQEADNVGEGLIEAKNTLCLLHVSDLHNNPASFGLIRRVLEAFDVNLIIDTGDLVDFGTTLEYELLLESLGSLPVPYVFVPGNHDSPAMLDQLKTVENVTVLEGGVMETAGLRIAAIADPSLYSPTGAISAKGILDETAKELEELVRDAGRVDVIAAHNPQCFNFLRSNGNLLLGGHTHHPSVVQGNHFIEINAGSSGASGIRGLQKLPEQQMCYSMVLIHFVSDEEGAPWRPYTADLVMVQQFPLNFTFERFMLDNN